MAKNEQEFCFKLAPDSKCKQTEENITQYCKSRQCILLHAKPCYGTICSS